MFGLGFGEILVIFIIVLLFVGPKKLPELAKGVGKGIRDFQTALKGQDSNSSSSHLDAHFQDEASKNHSDSKKS